MIYEKAAAVLVAGAMAVSSVQAACITAADDSAAKAAITVERFTLTHEEAEAGKVQTLSISVSGTEGKYSALGFHVYWDSALTPVKNADGEILTKGAAIKGMACEQTELENGVFVTASSGYNDGKDGILFTLDMKIPSVLPEEDTDYFVRVVFEENSKTGDVFMNYEEDEQGALMQEQIISSLKDGGISVISEVVTTTTSTTTTSTVTTARSSATTTVTATSSATKNTTTSSTTTAPQQPELNIGDLDNNGIVIASDASLLLVLYADLSDNGRDVTEDDIYVCDVNRSGRIEAGDASMILTYYAAISGENTMTFPEYLKSRGVKI